jgi:tetratricopeptide (TPR) repeat protein
MGFVQTSTDRLMGRKLFVWGASVGGRRWQEYLSQPGRAYIEIQAGLARTQAECVPMPGKTEWSWTEAFGLLAADPGVVHGAGWRTAWQGVDQALERALTRRDVERIDNDLSAVATRRPVEFLQTGSGWGALERYRCRSQRRPDPIGSEFVFEESTLGEEQRPWMDLIDNGRLPELDVSETPVSWMIQEDYESLLRESIREDLSSKAAWLSWLHLGIMRYERGDIEGAKAAWQSSIRCRPSMWAYRNLAAVSVWAKEFSEAKEYYEKAWDLGPKGVPLAVELLQNLNELKDYVGMTAFVWTLPPEVRSHERVHIWSARAAIEQDELEGIESLFEREFVTIREGEETLTNIWYQYQAKKLARVENRPVDENLLRQVRRECPPPMNINYQMFNEEYFKTKV